MKNRVYRICLFVVTFAISIVTFNKYIYAKVGDLIGRVYSTDIVCDIDGMKIQSYNIGGQTAINVEDLVNYGFEIEWISGPPGILEVSTKEKPTVAPEYIPTEIKKVGTIVGNVYETDIRVHFNHYIINPENTYNIGGKTLISVEELGNVYSEYIATEGFPAYKNSFEVYGYSKYAVKTEWDKNSRTISVKTLRPNDIIKADIGNVKIDDILDFITVSFSEFQDYCDFIDVIEALNLEYTFENNVLSVSQTENSRDAYEKERYASITKRADHNPIAVTLDTANGEKINGFISYGKLKIKFEDFARISGYKHERQNPITGSNVNRLSKN